MDYRVLKYGNEIANVVGAPAVPRYNEMVMVDGVQLRVDSVHHDIANLAIIVHVTD